MTRDELYSALHDRFDAGEDLTPALRAELERNPDAKAYWQELKALDASLWRLPLETPSPDLVTRLHHGLARDREIRFWKQAAAVTGLVAIAAATIAVGWRYPEYSTPQTWWYAASQYLPEQAWLEDTTPLEDQIAGVWATFQATARSFALPLPMSLGLVAAAAFVLILFNATGARVLRAAGGVPISSPHHHGKGV